MTNHTDLTERLVRIETKLDRLMEDRKEDAGHIDGLRHFRSRLLTVTTILASGSGAAAGVVARALMGL